jgi:hypothetical protein
VTVLCPGLLDEQASIARHSEFTSNFSSPFGDSGLLVCAEGIVANLSRGRDATSESSCPEYSLRSLTMVFALFRSLFRDGFKCRGDTANY